MQTQASTNNESNLEYSDLIFNYLEAKEMQDKEMELLVANLLIEDLTKDNLELLIFQSQSDPLIKNFIDNFEEHVQEWIKRDDSLLAKSMKSSFSLSSLQEIKNTGYFYIQTYCSMVCDNSTYHKYYQHGLIRMLLILELCGCKIKHICIYDIQIQDLKNLVKHLSGNENIITFHTKWSSERKKKSFVALATQNPVYYNHLYYYSINTFLEFVNKTKSLRDVIFDTINLEQEHENQINRRINFYKTAYSFGLLLFARKHDSKSIVYDLTEDIFKPIANMCVSCK